MDKNKRQLYIDSMLGLLDPLSSLGGSQNPACAQELGLVSGRPELKAYIDYASKLTNSMSAPLVRRSATNQLVSIFDSIINAKGQKPNEGHINVFPLAPLSLKLDACFPYKWNSAADKNQKEQYRLLWDNLKKEAQALLSKDANRTKAIMSIVRKYAWCIPSELDCASATSLFDKVKIISALSVCLFDYCKYNNLEIEDLDESVTAQEPFLLVGCDVSGIQNFIYDIASRKAAVSLKGRSFYVQLVIDSAIRQISNHPEIQALPTQVVYSSGGKCYMILPNTKGVKDALSKISKEIETELFATHHGQLATSIDCVSFGFKDKLLSFDGGEIGEIGNLWNYLAQRLTDNKNRKFKSCLDIDLFKAHPVDASVHVCAVTGIESRLCLPIDPKEENPTYVLPIVKKQAILGQRLKDASYILSWLGDGGMEPDIEIFGVKYKLVSKSELSLTSCKSEDITISVINSTENPNTNTIRADWEYKFYGGNRQALDIAGHNKTFEELADGQYLGVLRMDVDNLGSMFVKGLPESAKNFAAYSTLSFLLDFFFSGYLNTIRNLPDFTDDVNILYSGGDDIFAIGRWDKLLEFAEQVRKNFAKMVGREDLSISGGAVFVGETFPIAKAAKLAGNAEDAAKKFNDGQKDSFNMFGQTVRWGEEFEYVKNMKQEFVDLIDYQSMSTSILHRIMILSGSLDNEVPSYLWHTAYYLTRFAKRSNEAVKDFCGTLQKRLCKIGARREYKLTSIAARWAEYQIRFNK